MADFVRTGSENDAGLRKLDARDVRSGEHMDSPKEALNRLPFSAVRVEICDTGGGQVGPYDSTEIKYAGVAWLRRFWKIILPDARVDAIGTDQSPAADAAAVAKPQADAVRMFIDRLEHFAELDPDAGVDGRLPQFEAKLAAHQRNAPNRHVSQQTAAIVAENEPVILKTQAFAALGQSQFAQNVQPIWRQVQESSCVIAQLRTGLVHDRGDSRAMQRIGERRAGNACPDDEDPAGF
jgi:hypothetical protein